MTLDLSDPMDRLYLETIPCRPSPAPSTDRGPTAQWAELQRQRDLWALAAELATAKSAERVA